MEEEIKKTLQEKINQNKVVIGERETLKAAAKGELEFVVFANNADQRTRAKLSATGVKLFEHEGDSEALSILCGKPFTVLVIGVKK